ncbi:phage holin, LLH family [Weissella confusa]|uniref:phage holin, LLH family n=1 Tax=Weissella confusa TaxID=1583 RepID=UPI00189C29DF|nr:phage holin, LLH family [Weissella confusa]
MTMNNLITFAEALWQSGIAPALLILGIGWVSKRFANNKRLTKLLGIAEGVVRWAEVTFDGGQTQKAQAIKQLNDVLFKQRIGQLFTPKQIDDAIETAVKNMKGEVNE